MADAKRDAYTDVVRARAMLLLLALSVVPAVLQLLKLGRILWSRIDYAYDVHWMEGGTLLHAYRLLQGQPIYPEPTNPAGFLSNPYPPFAYMLLAATGSIFGLDYDVGRALAIAGSALSAAILTRAVYVQFKDLPAPWAPALLTLGAIAAGFPLTGGWYDAIMTEPVALALAILGAQAVLTDGRTFGTYRLILAACLMVATIFTKQTYAALVAWQVLFVCRHHVRRGLVLALAVALPTSILLAIAQYATNGAFMNYVAWQVLVHPSDPHRALNGATIVLGFAPYLPAALLGAVLLALKRSLSSRSLLWVGMLVASFPVALVPYSKVGGWDNNFMVIVFLAPPAAFCVLRDVCRLLSAPRQEVLLGTWSLLASIYLLVRHYPEEPFIADRGRHAAAARVNDYIASVSADVLIPSRPFLAIRQGTRVEQVHVMAWYDALFGGHPYLTFNDFIRRTRPRYVLLTGQEPGVMLEAMAYDYFMLGAHADRDFSCADAGDAIVARW